ncbi:MAG: sugar phosphate nucleotidyltransferase, partial [Nanoarchaeota archaeon]
MVLKCVIPAGGKGTRLRPYTEEIPKPLVEVAGKPLLYCTLQTLKKLKVKDIILVNGYKAEMIEDYIEKNAKDFNAVCITQKEEEMLGLPSTIISAEKEIDDDFIILLPDFIFVEDMNYVIQKHQQTKSDSTIVLAKGIPWINCGSFKLEGDFITAINLNDGTPKTMHEYLAYGMDVQKPDFIDSCKKLKLSKRNQLEIVEAYISRLNEGKKLVGVPAKK